MREVCLRCVHDSATMVMMMMMMMIWVCTWNERKSVGMMGVF